MWQNVLKKTVSQKYTLSNKIYRFNQIVDVKNDARTNFLLIGSWYTPTIITSIDQLFTLGAEPLFVFLTEEYKKKTLPLSGQAFEVAEARHSGLQFVFNSNET